MATVYIPAMLRPLAGGKAKAQAEGSTLRDVIANLELQFEGLRGRIVDEAGIRPEIGIAIGAVEAFTLSDPVTEESEVYIIPAIAGGAWRADDVSQAVESEDRLIDKAAFAVVP